MSNSELDMDPETCLMSDSEFDMDPGTCLMSDSGLDVDPETCLMSDFESDMDSGDMHNCLTLTLSLPQKLAECLTLGWIWT